MNNAFKKHNKEPHELTQKLRRSASFKFYANILCICLQAFSFSNGSHLVAFATLAIWSAVMMKLFYIADIQYCELCETLDNTFELIEKLRPEKPNDL